NGELIEVAGRGGASQTFDDAHLCVWTLRAAALAHGCSNPPSLSVEVYGFNHQGATFPVTSGVAHPLTDVFMRTSIQRYDADVMYHLGDDHQRIVSLHQLIVIVVKRRQHRRATGDPCNTPLDRRHVFRSIMRLHLVVL